MQCRHTSVKERITVTIEHALLKTIDASVDGVQVKNRSHAIELLIEGALKQVMPTQAVILAGGDRKQLLRPIDGKAAVVHNIELLSRHGVSDILMVVSKNDPKVKEFLGSGSQFDVHLRYFEEKEPMGTAGALQIVRDELRPPFILLNGDEVKQIDLRDMFNFHKQQRGNCTIALTSVKDPSLYGVALLNGNHIVAFVEKPTGNSAPSNLVSAGLYILERDAVLAVPRGFAKIETDVFPKLAREGKLIGYPFSGSYVDAHEEEPGVAERLTAPLSSILRTLR